MRISIKSNRIFRVIITALALISFIAIEVYGILVLSSAFSRNEGWAFLIGLIIGVIFLLLIALGMMSQVLASITKRNEWHDKSLIFNGYSCLFVLGIWIGDEVMDLDWFLLIISSIALGCFLFHATQIRKGIYTNN